MGWFRKNGKKNNYGRHFVNHRINYLTEFDLNIDIMLILYMFWGKILYPFFKGWWENIGKSGDAQWVLKIRINKF